MAQGDRGRGLNALAVAVAAALTGLGCVPQLAIVDGRIFGNTVKLRPADARIYGQAESPGFGLRVEIARRGDYSPAHVGHLVHEAFFADAPPFYYNVEFACGPGGAYTDPASWWFNVFLGYYEIDVPKATWSRPFGYESASPDARVRHQDLLGIGKADWDYFSNYIYGVPLARVQQIPSPDRSRATQLPREELAPGRSWDLIEFADLDVISGYVSGKDGQSLVENAFIYSEIWRDLFGASRPRPDFPTSFLRTRMQGRTYLSFTEGLDPYTGEPVYTTTIFGGTINDTYPDAAKNQLFLAAQMEAIVDVIRDRFSDRGFR